MADVREMRIFSADQIEVPQDLPSILKDFSKEVIRHNPADLVSFSRKYFEDKREQSKKSRTASVTQPIGGTDNHVPRAPQYANEERNVMLNEAVAEFWQDFDENNSGRLERNEVRDFAERATGYVGVPWNEDIFTLVLRQQNPNGDQSVHKDQMTPFLIALCDQASAW